MDGAPAPDAVPTAMQSQPVDVLDLVAPITEPAPVAEVPAKSTEATAEPQDEM